MSWISIKHNLIYHMPRRIAHSLIYIKKHKRKMNWRSPILYDEKIHWLMVHEYDSRYGKYADKLQVRDYVKACGFENLLIPLLGVYKSSDNIVYDNLPDKFILKTTQGSGEQFYEICAGKKNFNIEKAKKKLDQALKTEFYKYHCEYQYEGIEPCIICEELLENGGFGRMDDYKIVCANGKAVAVLVCSSRNEGRDYFSCSWRYLNYVKEKDRSGKKIEKPEKLNEMIHAAEILAKPFPLARIDFYICGSRIYFGEITLTPSAGNHSYLNEVGQRKLGEAIVLPSLSKNKEIK